VAAEEEPVTDLYLIDVVGYWLGIFLTFCILSFLYKDNPFYKLAEHLFVGVSIGYIVAQQYYNVLRPKVFEPLVDGSPMTKLIAFVPLILVVMMFVKAVSRRFAWVGRYPLAFVVALFAGIQINAVAQSELGAQINRAMMDLDAEKVDVNTASAKQLALLPGIVPPIAEKIIAYREGPVVGIGARGDDPAALDAMIAGLPAGFGLTVVVVADPAGTEDLVARLAAHAKLPVHLVSDGTVVAPNHVYVAPPDREIVLIERTLRLDDLRGPATERVDRFLATLAGAVGADAAAVVLHDGGHAGLRAVADAGGLTASAAPGAAVHVAAPVAELPAALLAAVRDPAAHGLTTPRSDRIASLDDLAAIPTLSDAERELIADSRGSIKGLDAQAHTGEGGRYWFGILSNILLLAGTLASLLYFYFSLAHKGVVGRVSRFGVWILMVGFGASFGYTVQGRIALAIGRAQDVMGTRMDEADAAAVQGPWAALASAAIIIVGIVVWEARVRRNASGQPGGGASE
jgi:hypothetical protein